MHIPKIQKVFVMPDLIFATYRWILYSWPEFPGAMQLEWVILKYCVLIREVQWKYSHKTPRSSRTLILPRKYIYTYGYFWKHFQDYSKYI